MQVWISFVIFAAAIIGLWLVCRARRRKAGGRMYTAACAALSLLAVASAGYLVLTLLLIGGVN